MKTNRDRPESSHLSEDQMSAYIDGDLIAPERVAVETHIAGCEQCARELALLTSVVDLLKVQPLPRPSRSFQLTAEQARPASFWDRFGVRLLPALPAFRAATIAVALLLSGVVAFERMSDRDTNVNDSAPANSVEFIATVPVSSGEVEGIVQPTTLGDEPETSTRDVEAVPQTDNSVAAQPTDEPSDTDAGSDAAKIQETELAIEGASGGAGSEADSFSAADSGATSLESEPAPAPAAESATDDAVSVSSSAGSADAPNQKAPANPMPEPQPATVAPATPTIPVPIAATQTPASEVQPSGNTENSNWLIAELSLLGVLVLLLALWAGLHRFRKSQPN